MTPYYQDAAVTLYASDAVAALRELPEQSIQTCITSPPYWGLRDYGTATWEGGEAECDHVFESDAGTTTQRVGRTYQQGHPHRDCKCGARRIDAQLGLERTPEEYVAKMVEVFREVRRVLRSDGTLWLNLGDSYTSGGRKERDPGQSKIHPAYEGDAYADDLRPDTPMGLKPKDLVGIPWRVAFALQADGWWLRSDIIWAKPNPMPESVTDRPTKAHEYLFLLAKSERYYYDAEAIAEEVLPASLARCEAGFVTSARDDAVEDVSIGANKRTRYGLRETFKAKSHRNRRSVWEIATQPYPEAHFATFPVELVKPCVLAGSKPGDTVLDPFAGSGTACYVAKELGRQAIGIDLNPAYLDLAAKRLRQEVLPL